MDSGIESLHPVCFVREYFNDKFLIFFSPRLHLRIRGNDKLDIFCDVLDLTSFRM
jgi:hypothetical protein